MRERIPRWIKNIVEIEKGAVCGICTQPIKFGDQYEIDHIYPIARGGSNSLDNLQVVHKNCNRKKGGNKLMTSQDQWKIWWDLVEPNLFKLRDNQREAFEETRERMVNLDLYPDKDYRIYPGGRPKIYCECTGAGKSILMIILGLYLTKKKLLIVTPSKVIKKTNFDALKDALDYGIVPKKVYDEIHMTTLDLPHSLAYIHTADIVVTTYQKFGKNDADRVLARLRGDEFDVVLVDEGHHYRDKDIDTTHQDIIKKFKNSIVLFFTATPFDGRLNPILSGFDERKDVIHEFKYADAWQKSYVKYIEWTEIKPEQQVLTITHPNGKTEKLELGSDDLESAKKKLDGYKTALSKSEATKLSLIYATIHLLDQRNDDLRGKVKKNIALIVCSNIKDAEECSRILNRMNTRYKHCVVHSRSADDTLLDEIKKDVYDILISVAMFKEGFSQKNVTIVTLCRNIESYVFFTQVIGRGVRARNDVRGNPVPVSGQARNMKDICYIVTHEGFELERHWRRFRELDLKYLTDEQEHKEKYLFSWSGVPGKDNNELLNFLENDHGIQVENARIIKANDDKTVQVLAGDKSVEILLDENKDKATLKISDGRMYDLQVKKENGNHNIYTYTEPEHKERIPSDIIEVSPSVTIIDEKVKGYASDGFDDGRTYRDETMAHYFREYVKTSGDTDLATATEKYYGKDEGRSFSKIFQQMRSREFVDMRNPSTQVAITLLPLAESKKDLQRETIDKAKMLQDLLRKHISRSLKRGIKISSEKWGILMKTMFNTFYQIHGHPLKGGASDGGYNLSPKDIDFINNELPKLIEKYKSHTYFKENFLPVFKKNLEKSVKITFIE